MAPKPERQEAVFSLAQKSALVMDFLAYSRNRPPKPKNMAPKPKRQEAVFSVAQNSALAMHFEA